MAAWSQAQLDALEDAYRQGHTKVKYADREVQYRSRSEMLAIIQEGRRALAGPKRKRFGLGTFRSSN